MAFNGSGVFQRLYNWANDAASNIKIRADRMDNEMNGFATGLSTCITKDGQTTVTANLPMATYRHTGVGNAQARTDYASLGQMRDGAAGQAASVGGTADVITLTFSPVYTAYATGMMIWWVASGANTGAVTVNVDSLGAKALTKNGTTAIAAGDIPSGAVITAVYDGTRFQLLNVSIADLAAVYQPLDSDLTSIAALSTTSFGRGLLTEASASSLRTTAGLGTAATQNTGTSGANVPLLNGTNTHSGANTFSGGVYSFVATLNDDTATSFTTPTSTGTFILSCGGVSSTNPRGLFHFRTSTAFLERLDTAPTQANVNLTTGALTGTTGTDTKFTLSAHTDGKLYFENRSGGTITISLFVVNGS